MKYEIRREDDALSQTACGKPLLIVEHDKEASFRVSVALEKEGFKTIAASDGQEALELAQQHDPIFVILDVVLPQMDGYEVCRELRRSSDVPILILTTRGEAHERIMGLTMGADDYVVKPCSTGEIIARVKAILRRARPDLTKATRVLSHQGLALNVDKRKVTLHGHPVSLTPFEYQLLRTLMTVAGRVFLRDELLNHLYPNGEAVVDRVIDVHIGNLRHKIEQDPSKPRYVLTVRGLGYQFADSDENSDETMRPAEDRYLRYFEDAITGIYQTTLDGHYLTANPMLARMFGYESSKELIENTIDLNDGFYVKCNRRAEFTDLIRKDESVRGFESQVYRRDGSIMWISEYALALKDSANNLIGFQGTSIDVTERKQAEKARQPLTTSSRSIS